LFVLNFKVLSARLVTESKAALSDYDYEIVDDSDKKMGERLKLLRERLGMTQDAFAEKVELTKNYISLVETGNRNLADRTLKDICRKLNVNEEWLRNGTGEMFLPISKDDEISELFGEVLRERDGNFKHRLVSALARLDEDGWDKLEELIDMLSGSK
jgi:HTH-type transcriptional regulator / antitoxin PezA